VLNVFIFCPINYCIRSYFSSKFSKLTLYDKYVSNFFSEGARINTCLVHFVDIYLTLSTSRLDDRYFRWQYISSTGKFRWHVCWSTNTFGKQICFLVGMRRRQMLIFGILQNRIFKENEILIEGHEKVFARTYIVRCHLSCSYIYSSLLF